MPCAIAAVHLPLDDHVIDDAPDVVAARQARDLHLAGLRVDLDLADLRAVRPRRRRWRLRRRDADHCAPAACAAISASVSERSVPAIANSPVAILDVRRRPPRAPRRRAPCRARWLAPPAATTAEPPTNAEREPTLPTPLARRCRPARSRTACRRNAEHLGDELRVRGLQPLPHRLRTRINAYRPSASTWMSTVSVRQRAGPFEIAGEAAAAQAAPALRASSLLPRTRSSPRLERRCSSTRAKLPAS